VLHPLYIGKSSDGILSIGDEKTLMSGRTAWKITHILADREARRRSFGGRNFLDFPFDVAAKTGTSKDYRDSWTAGFTPEYTVAVWVGNFSGKPMQEVSGGWGAGRIFHQVMRILAADTKPSFNYPRDFEHLRLCRKTGLIAAAGCPSYIELVEPGEQIALCTGGHGSGEHADVSEDGSPLVISPVSGESYILDPLSPTERQTVPVSIRYAGKAGIYAYSIDNAPFVKLNGNLDRNLHLARGEHSLSILREGMECRRVVFTVE